jgi:hypothetical protein
MRGSGEAWACLQLFAQPAALQLWDFLLLGFVITSLPSPTFPLPCCWLLLLYRRSCCTTTPGKSLVGSAG